ncbi:MAG: hypothetical protein ACD_48C00098G0002 [uncultured bacterium]|nr:MAG: hypothetical protein ACD_48C00098G0002 [uncultured bacterium]
MPLRKSYLLPLLTGGFFFVLDQILKYISHTQQKEVWYLIKPWIGWEYFANPGIAFSIPFPNAVLIIGTPLILIALLTYIGGKKQRSPYHIYGSSLIFFGAISNLIDRVLFAITIDYIRILTTVLNIADIMIIVGTLCLIIGSSQQTLPDIDKTEHI